jgi:hypothetical protein
MLQDIVQGMNVKIKKGKHNYEDENGTDILYVD